MRQDQFESLQARAEQLVDVFLNESDPARWPGNGIEPAKMEKTTRGDRYWCKKDAVATLACVQRITTLLQVIRERSAGGDAKPAGGVADGPSELDEEVARAEKEATQLLDELRQSGRKAQFDKRVHGKG